MTTTHNTTAIATHAAAHNARFTTSYSEATRFTDFDVECVDGRFAIIHGMHFDLTQYDNRYIVTVTECEEVFDVTCDASHALLEENFVCAVAYSNLLDANELFVMCVSGSLSVTS